MGNIQPPPPQLSEAEMRQVMNFDLTIRNIVDRLKNRPQPNSIVLMVGAGLSVSAGIPDFRSKGTGLYDNLQKYNLPRPEAIFDISYFEENPMPFYTLAKEMYPGNFSPTVGHFFIRLLQDKGLLRRCYTQNIDTLERQAGVDPVLLVEAHGSFGSARCTKCGHTYTQEWVKEKIFGGHVPVLCASCKIGYVKPDIVFFGENLPERFRRLRSLDLDDEVECLMIMGTSLSVRPFAGLADEAHPFTPRLLMNRDVVGLRGGSTNGHGLRLDCQDNYRDTALLGDLDTAVITFCTAMGWMDDLSAVVNAYFDAATRADVASLPENHPLRRLASIQVSLDEAIKRDWRAPPKTLPPLSGFSAAGALSAGAEERIREAFPGGEGLPKMELVSSGLDEGGSEVKIVVDITPAKSAKSPDSEPNPNPDPNSSSSSSPSPSPSNSNGPSTSPSLNAKPKPGPDDAKPNPEREDKKDGADDADGAKKEDSDNSDESKSDDEEKSAKDEGDRDWIGLFKRMDGSADSGELAAGAFNETKHAPDDPRLSALGVAVLPRQSQLLELAKQQAEGRKVMLRVTLTDDQRRWGDPAPEGPHEIWYLRGKDLLCRWGPVNVVAPVPKPDDDDDDDDGLPGIDLSNIDPANLPPRAALEAMLAQLHGAPSKPGDDAGDAMDKEGADGKDDVKDGGDDKAKASAQT